MDIVQIILVVAVSILTTILTLVGFEVFLIFREFHRSLKKCNQVLDDFASVSSAVSQQVNNLSDFLGAAKTTFDLAKVFLKKEEKTKEEEAKLLLEEETAHSPLRRFFTRAGKRLS